MQTTAYIDNKNTVKRKMSRNLVRYTQETVPAAVPAFDREQLLRTFLKQQDIKNSSRKTYKDSIHQFFAWLDQSGRSLQGLTREDIITFKNDLLHDGHSVLTVRSYLVAIRQFYKWAEGLRLYEDIAASVKNPRLHKQGSSGRFMKMHLTSD